MEGCAAVTLIQKLGIFYAIMFFAVVAIGYVPAFNDANGYCSACSRCNGTTTCCTPSRASGR
jgi:hypothetical protein